MPGFILNSSTFGRQRVGAAFVDIVQAIEDEDQGDSVLSKEGDIVFDGFAEAEWNAPEGVFERFFVVAVQAQVEVVGSVDTNDCIFE